MYFNKKKVISYCIIFETKIFMKMVICVALDSKSACRQGKACLFINFQGMKICNSNGSKIKRRNIQSIQHAIMCHTYCFG